MRSLFQMKISTFFSSVPQHHDKASYPGLLAGSSRGISSHDTLESGVVLGSNFNNRIAPCFRLRAVYSYVSYFVGLR